METKYLQITTMKNGKPIEPSRFIIKTIWQQAWEWILPILTFWIGIGIGLMFGVGT